MSYRTTGDIPKAAPHRLGRHAGLLIIAGAAAYANSFGGMLLLDDARALDRAAMAGSDCLWTAVRGTARPLADLSLALNFRLSGREAWSYHGVNIVIHILASVVLMALIHRTLLLPQLRERWAGCASRLAAAAALLWLLHPLHTGSVTYIAQRCESLMGLFYLLTMYCVVRSAECGRWLWGAGAVVAAACGMATKEVMVTAPFMVLLYEFVFLVPCWKSLATRTSPGQILQNSSNKALAARGRSASRRGALHAALLATSAIPAVLWCWNIPPAAVPSAGFGLESITPPAYALTQPGVILRYLSLSLWPYPQCLDYGWPLVAGATRAVPAAAVVFCGAAVALWGLRRRAAWGFCAAWVLGVLAPTSSVMPIDDPAFEHRMYLPLAGIIVGVVGAAAVLARRWGALPASGPSTQLTGHPCAAVAVESAEVPAPAAQWPRVSIVVSAVLLALLTVRRNSDYRSAVIMWSGVVTLRPGHARAHCNLGNALALHGFGEDAAACYRRALQINPDHAEAVCNLGKLLLDEGHCTAASACFRDAVRLNPRLAAAHNNLGAALAAGGWAAEAASCFERAVALNPADAEAHSNLAGALLDMGRADSAVEHSRAALRVDPHLDTARRHLGSALLRRGDTAAAIAELRRVLATSPDSGEAHNDLGIALARSGCMEEAVRHFRRALEIRPQDVSAGRNLERALAQ